MSAFRVRDNFGENLAAALNDAKDGALAGAAPGLSGTADAARTARSEVAFVNLNDAVELVIEGRLVIPYPLAENAIVAIDGVAIQIQKLGRLRCREISAESRNQFSLAISRQPILDIHISSLR